MPKTRLLETLKQTPGWSANIRFPYQLTDKDGALIQELWIKPLTRAEQADLAEGGNKDLTIRMLCRALHVNKTGSEKVFEVGEIPEIKRELSHFMLNELEMAMINAGKPNDPDEGKAIIEAEKKDSEATA